MLENEINGPLYKVVMKRQDPSNRKEWFIHLLTGPSAISVSKINQLISLFVTIIWAGLFWYARVVGAEYSLETGIVDFYEDLAEEKA